MKNDSRTARSYKISDKNYEKGMQKAGGMGFPLANIIEEFVTRLGQTDPTVIETVNYLKNKADEEKQVPRSATSE